ncbi:trace amine-associated receptor 13c-like [Fundulus heteroclitus]|uniref:trace amine-associated receptor 13c-like n=1 Tax=Fundulus heteroclitus TaxID=8078 RepID=UPI00165B6F4B|nr:trace amine-associated receptor 13c-like [Fundulus heteroclitus]
MPNYKDVYPTYQSVVLSDHHLSLRVKPQLHKPTNILLLSLAVSDLLVGFISMPGAIYQNTSCWFLGDNICFLYNYLCFIIPSTSVGDMVLISIDRYVAICDPLHYQTRVTKRRVKVCVCLCWVCSVVYNILFLKDDLIQAGWNSSCYGGCVNTVDLISGTFDLVLTFIAPITIIIILYMRVFVVAVFQARAMRSHIRTVKLQHSVTTTARKSELKAARTLGVLVVLFLISVCPTYCVYLAGVETFSDSSAFAVDFLFYFNSCVNPVIYALFYPWFRKTAKLIITLQILKPGSCKTIIQ